jgi:hypothetical protein
VTKCNCSSSPTYYRDLNPDPWCRSLDLKPLDQATVIFILNISIINNVNSTLLFSGQIFVIKLETNEEKQRSLKITKNIIDVTDKPKAKEVNLKAKSIKHIESSKNNQVKGMSLKIKTGYIMRNKDRLNLKLMLSLIRSKY